MCNGAESRGNINGEVVISKVENCHEERMRNTEGSERACHCGTGLLQRIYHHLNTLLPNISVSEVSNLDLSFYLSICLSICLSLSSCFRYWTCLLGLKDEFKTF
jgi:hypothetical protein